MKKVIYSIILFSITKFGFSQADLAAPVVGHIGVPGYYLGWNATTGIPLQIRHNGAQPINFFTVNTQRMTMTPNGLVGLAIYKCKFSKFIL